MFSSPSFSSVQFVAPIARCFESGCTFLKPIIPFVWFVSVPGGDRTFFMTFFFVYGSSGIFRISVLFCGIFIFRGILRMLTSPVWFEVCPDSCMLCCSHHAVRACCCCAGLCVRFVRICSMVLGSRPRLVSTCYCAGLCVRFARFCSMVLWFRPRLVSTIFRGCSLF